MWNVLLIHIISPIVVGIVITLFSDWLNQKDDD
ncbi:type I toxin-antitoxin system Fst family toxin [Streptococcus suis]|nr:type I toxin-antitoxin system Fst family toxin [Streptococcus suis]